MKRFQERWSTHLYSSDELKGWTEEGGYVSVD